MQQRRLHRKQRRKHFHTGDNIIIWRRTVRIFGSYYNSWQLLLWRTSLGILGNFYNSWQLLLWRTSVGILGNFYYSWQLLLWRTSLWIFGRASPSMESTSSLASWKTLLQTLTFSMQSRWLKMMWGILKNVQFRQSEYWPHWRLTQMRFWGCADGRQRWGNGNWGQLRSLCWSDSL